MTTALTHALAQLPRKGETSWPFAHRDSRTGRGKAPWLVAANLHEWALANGYLTGAIFKRTQRSKTSLRLLLVGPCPYTPGRLRYYTASLSPNLSLEAYNP